jgi:hypothetical protein
MAKRKYHRRFPESIEDRDPEVIWLELGDGHVVRDNDKYAVVDDLFIVYRDADVLFQTQIINLGQHVDRGRIVHATTPAWVALRKEVLERPSLLKIFPASYRKFEEFVAGAYVTSHWTDVILSPRSHDGGFDIAAWKRGRQILDDVKAYKPSLHVDHEKVRAVLGLFHQHTNIDQVRLTTTSTFAPTVQSDFRDAIIRRDLVLRDQRELLRWLHSIGD